jgi:RNA 3'-terminal phosphate cyclase (ATP)
LTDVLIIDGSQGEGGGQILRTALSLSIVATRAFRLVNIRARRRNPGLLPQHLSAVRAAAAISGAAVSGDRLGSAELVFAPSHPARHGRFVFDVAETAERGSTGSITLVLQTLLVPLAWADGASTLVLRGGTHVEWSPPFDHLVSSYFPILRRMGFRVDAELNRWGWYPAGGGEVACRIAAGAAGRDASWPSAIELLRRGSLRRITGRAVVANLPAHIPQRMTGRAQAALGDLGVPVDIPARQVTAACPGAGIFLVAEYDELTVSFCALGRLGKPSEAVADEAVAAFREHHDSGAAVELHLADQLLLPLALANGASAFTVPRPTGHLTTNARTIGQFGIADIAIEPGTPCRVRIAPRS